MDQSLDMWSRIISASLGSRGAASSYQRIFLLHPRLFSVCVPLFLSSFLLPPPLAQTCRLRIRHKDDVVVNESSAIRPFCVRFLFLWTFVRSVRVFFFSFSFFSAYFFFCARINRCIAGLGLEARARTTEIRRRWLDIIRSIYSLEPITKPFDTRQMTETCTRIFSNWSVKRDQRWVGNGRSAVNK